MKKAILFLICFAGPARAGFAADGATFETPVFKAMRAELARNGARLRADRYPLPYFLAYTVTRTQEFETQATFGSTVSDELEARALARAELRVGSEKFDNSNFVKGFGDSNDYLSWTDRDGGYAAVRRALWEISDDTYNAAVQALAKKSALARTRNLADQPDDFSPSTPAIYAGGIKPFGLDRPALVDAARSASAVFRRYADIMVSGVTLSVSQAESSYANSENTMVHSGGALGAATFNAETMAADGMPIKRSRSFVYAQNELPSAGGLAGLAAQFAGSVSASVHGSTLAAYVGPVLFEGAAAGQLFSKFFAGSVYAPRPSWSEFGQENGMGAFYNRLGLRVMSPLFSVTDDPLAKEHNGAGLVGSYEVDSEGVPARAVQLVKKGKLLDLLMSRAPARERFASNGHGRATLFSVPRGSASNLFFRPAVTVPDADLKTKLLALCRDYDLEYGILVRDAGDFSGDMEIYKVYAADGREEPLRGVRFDALNNRVLRDIVSAGAALNVYNTMVNGIPVSVVAPSVLVSEAELKAVDTKPEKFPYLKHPYFDKR
ncbi:MAG: metallopeptidase TldD-related protein [Elusimicrobiaceae bacterium]|nr:metallopeptidase TldD-related protein [Elusimicrobiaceae bacterium]